MVIHNNSFRVGKNLEPLQKRVYVHTRNCFCQDVSTDASNYKAHKHFTSSDQKNSDPSLSHEVQEPVTLESSTENTTCREVETTRMQGDQTICIQEDHFGHNIDRSDDDYKYFQCLATIVHSVSEELLTSVLNGNACTPIANKDLIMIMENLKLPLQVYSKHQEDLSTMKLANTQVKRQYKQLKKVIEKLSEEKHLQISFEIPADKFLSKPGLQEYVESRDIQSLVQAINKLNKISARRSQCNIM